MKIFKYVHPQRLDVLENKMICFSTPHQLNDPFELKPHIRDIATQETYNSLIEEKVKNLKGEYSKLPRNDRRQMSFDQFCNQVSAFTHQKLTKDMRSSLAMKAQAIFDKELSEKIGILSLTERSDNLLMWAHYADSHQGFIIEFDPESAFFKQRRSDVDEFGYLRSVTYSEFRPSLTLEEIKDFSPFLTKGKVWERECEWRMMLPIHMCDKKLPCGHNLFSFPATAIKSIILGCRITDLTKNKIKSIIDKDPELSHVKLMIASIDQEHYRVNIN
ncbi:DUF2971 domain-containing protein [Pseudomonas proteolytica]|uniref:DUF2971 domain-containing protein n=1 Tax=Pseudomonas proteolytica TaxID=219574 RepID=UPI0014730EF4|nr:DUF2971 domain-containing protein [Pseudomonas proteolytica]NMZ34065.1 DUF2971 domain-containing protein [Pseudomonas proteolytica]